MFATQRDACAEVTPAQLSDTIGQLHALMVAVQHELLVAVAAYQKSEFWRADGATGMAGWLVASLGVSQPTANAWAGMAELLATRPALAAAFSNGELSFDQLRPAAQWATPETDGQVAADAPGMSVAQLQARARRTPDERDTKDAHRRRSLRWWSDHDGASLRFSGRLPIAEGNLVATALERIAQRLPRNSETAPRDAFDARCADALVELANQALADDSDANRATIVVHAPLDAVLAAHDQTDLDHNTLPRLDDGSPLAVRVLRRLACDSRIQTVIDGELGPVGIGRTSRSVPAWLMRQLRHRDKHCRYPGCERRANLHAHHIIHWADDGPTDLDNLVLVCWHHHHFIHDHGGTVEGHPSRHLIWRRPNGRRVPNRPPPLRAATRQRMFGVAA